MCGEVVLQNPFVGAAFIGRCSCHHACLILLISRYYLENLSSNFSHVSEFPPTRHIDVRSHPPKMQIDKEVRDERQRGGNGVSSRSQKASIPCNGQMRI